jgi:hypothetical protein
VDTAIKQQFQNNSKGRKAQKKNCFDGTVRSRRVVERKARARRRGSRPDRQAVWNRARLQERHRRGTTARAPGTERAGAGGAENMDGQDAANGHADQRAGKGADLLAEILAQCWNATPSVAISRSTITAPKTAFARSWWAGRHGCSAIRPPMPMPVPSSTRWWKRPGAVHMATRHAQLAAGEDGGRC